MGWVTRTEAGEFNCKSWSYSGQLSYQLGYTFSRENRKSKITYNYGEFLGKGCHSGMSSFVVLSIDIPQGRYVNDIEARVTMTDQQCWGTGASGCAIALVQKADNANERNVLGWCFVASNKEWLDYDWKNLEKTDRNDPDERMKSLKGLMEVSRKHIDESLELQMLLCAPNYGGWESNGKNFSLKALLRSNEKLEFAKLWVSLDKAKKANNLMFLPKIFHYDFAKYLY